MDNETFVVHKSAGLPWFLFVLTALGLGATLVLGRAKLLALETGAKEAHAVAQQAVQRTRAAEEELQHLKAQLQGAEAEKRSLVAAMEEVKARADTVEQALKEKTAGFDHLQELLNQRGRKRR